ncbi:MAG: bifunctional glycosyltransferase family 2/GtrA family protein [bacterium]|nr:bifunctional glycosyltransferase family 2/GtrA family protein [bacterium]
MRRIALIPAYQPDWKLLKLTEKLSERGYSIVVVDDGSNASCAPVFEAIGEHALVVAHECNMGKGEALKTGMRAIRDRFLAPYAVVTADADGQHLIDDIDSVAQGAIAEPDSLVLGCRGFCGKVPLRSRLGNSITRLVFKLVTRSRVSDTQTGLRAFTHRSLDWMAAVSGSRYEYEMKVLMEWVRSGRKVSEVPIETVYLDGNEASHFNAIRDSYSIYREILRFSGSSFVSFLADYAIFSISYAVMGSMGLSFALVAANVLARIASATLNYALNRKLVFAHKGSAVKSALKYALLAAGMLAINTLLLEGAVAIGTVPYFAKIAVELVLFAVNYCVQRKFVFKSSGKGGKGVVIDEKADTGWGSVRGADSGAYRIHSV